MKLKSKSRHLFINIIRETPEDLRAWSLDKLGYFLHSQNKIYYKLYPSIWRLLFKLQ